MNGALRWAVAASLLLAACGGTEEAPLEPGTLTLAIRADGPPAGAMVLTITGGPVTAAVAIGTVQLAERRDEAGLHLIVVGDISGTVATLTIPDASRAGAYAVTVEQVAERSAFTLLDPSPYFPSLTLHR